VKKYGRQKGKAIYTLLTTEHRKFSSRDVFNTYVRNGWFAFNSNRRCMALEYAMKAIFMFPFRLAGWLLLDSTLVKKTTSKFSYTII